MKQSAIKEDRTYCGSSPGSRRKVLRIHKPRGGFGWVVEWTQPGTGFTRSMSLFTFAVWAVEEVPDEPG